jgi:hypothetical protein
MIEGGGVSSKKSDGESGWLTHSAVVDDDEEEEDDHESKEETEEGEPGTSIILPLEWYPSHAFSLIRE